MSSLTTHDHDAEIKSWIGLQKALSEYNIYIEFIMLMQTSCSMGPLLGRLKTVAVKPQGLSTHNAVQRCVLVGNGRLIPYRMIMMYVILPWMGNGSGERRTLDVLSHVWSW